MSAKIVTGVLGFVVLALLAWPFAAGYADYSSARATQRYADACEIATKLASQYDRIGFAGQAAGWRGKAEADCSISRLQALN